MSNGHAAEHLPTPTPSNLVDNAAHVPSSPPRRTKRTKYTPRACDQCKRLKVKCSGDHPCRRCARDPAHCTYNQTTSGNARASSNTKAPRSTNVISRMDEKIAHLEEQISLLTENTALHRAASGVSPQDNGQFSAPADIPSASQSQHSQERQRSQRLSSHPDVMGSTSNAFSLGVARSSLLSAGMRPDQLLPDDGTTSTCITPSSTPPLVHHTPGSGQALSLMSYTEMNRLIDLYSEESGSIYPFIDIDKIKTCAQRICRGIGQRKTVAKDQQPLPGDTSAWEGDVDIMKMVIAIALVIEGQGQSVMAMRLAEEVEPSVNRGLAATKSDIQGLRAFTLLSIYQFHCDEEMLAWRTIGISVRIALEMGLNRRETLIAGFKDKQQRLWANKMFWCVYVLDRRWSFGVGMPFALHDLDIDPDLPEPDNGNSYLSSMIAYGHLGSKVWKSMSGFISSSMPQVSSEVVAFLDFQVSHWWNSVPTDLKLQDLASENFDRHSRSANRLRALLFLNANQMKILIHKRTLLTPATITGDLRSARVAVDAAKENIRLLQKLNQLTDIYCAQQTYFNYFLVSGITMTFLAVCHAPAQFAETCREEISIALGMIKGFSATSFVAQKLWKTIKHWKPRLGVLAQRDEQQQQIFANDTNNNNIPSGHAAGGNAPPNSYPISTIPSTNMSNVDNNNGMVPPAETPFSSSFDPAFSYNYPLDGNQLSDELTNLFQAIEPRATSSSLSSQFQMNQDLYPFGFDGEISRTLIDMF